MCVERVEGWKWWKMYRSGEEVWWGRWTRWEGVCEGGARLWREGGGEGEAMVLGSGGASG